MNRSTAQWTTALAIAVALALPSTGYAQDPASAQQPPAAAAASQDQQPAAGQEHLRKAKEVLNSIQPASIPAQVKTRINELKQRVSKLERASANQPAGTPAAKNNVKWDAEVAAIDRTLTQLIGSDAPAPTGTTGTAAAGMKLEPDVRGKLAEFRTHITAFAAAMAGAPAPPAPSTDPASATSGQPPATSAQPPATSAQPPATSAQPPATSAQPPATSAEPPAASAQPPAKATAAVDADAAKQHLTAARTTLSELTQLPAAAQLTGDSRTQVTQLISNFNDLITTNSEWRAAYAKVDANLDALLGSETTDENPARATASGTAGAVGTSGTVAALDPGIRGKLVEFRNHLEKFELAAGGAAKPGESPKPSDPGASGASGASTMTSSTAATQTPAAQSAASQPPAAAGQMDQQEILRHIQAIEAIVQSAGSTAATSSASSSAGTSGTTGTTATTGTTQAGLTLTAAQADQLRTHLNELKRLLNQK